MVRRGDGGRRPAAARRRPGRRASQGEKAAKPEVTLVEGDKQVDLFCVL